MRKEIVMSYKEECERVYCKIINNCKFGLPSEDWRPCQRSSVMLNSVKTWAHQRFAGCNCHDTQKKSLQHCCHWYWDDVKPGFQMSRCNFRVYWVFEASSKAVQNPSLISCSCTIKRCIWCMLSWISVYFVGIIAAHSSSFLLLFWFWANMNTWVVSILVCPSSEWGIVFLNMKLGFESASWK